MEQIASLLMHAKDHRTAERAAGLLGKRVLTLSRDMAFLGNVLGKPLWDKHDLLKSIYRRLGTIR